MRALALHTAHPMLHRLAILVLATAIAPQGHAKEGYSHDFAPIPAAVRAWEQKTFLVSKGGLPHGTAFLVHNDGESLYFLTASHVARGCFRPEPCSLYLNAYWDLRKHPETPISGDVVLPLDAKSAFIFIPHTRNWMNLGAEVTDLAVFKTPLYEGAPKASFDELGPFTLPTLPLGEVVARKHYTIGYPGLWARPSLRETEAGKVMRLRWAEGERLKRARIVQGGFMVPDKPMRKYRLYTDSDSIPGNSGGPVVDENGKLLGVVYGGPRAIEYISFPTFFSYVVSIDYARVFLKALTLGSASARPLCEDPFHKDQESCRRP